jgi:uncharacterized protein
MAFLVGLVVVLAFYNNALNLLGPPGALYVPVNLAMTAVLLGWARRQGYPWETLGLHRPAVAPGLRWGAAVAAGAAVVLGIGLLVPAAQPLYDDQRVAGLTSAGLAYQALVRIPFGTVALEEVAFRGVLLGVWRRQRGTAEAVVGSSAVFGLWHIGPTLVLLDVNDISLSAAGLVLVLTAAVVGTGLAGGLFALLRLRTGGIIGPAVAHAGLNGLATLAAFVSQRGA